MTRSYAQFDEGFLEPSTEPSRILVVEDHEGCRLVTTTYLDLCGWTYDVCHSGEEAAYKACTRDYALILMDVKLRDMDGLEATRRIRAFERRNEKTAVTIIAVTAYALVGDKERCIAAGMDDYIAKPFDCLFLKEKLAASLASRSAATNHIANHR